MFDMKKFVEAFIQSTVWKRIHKSRLTDTRRGNTLSDKSRENVERANDRVFAAESGSADVSEVVVADDNAALY